MGLIVKSVSVAWVLQKDQVKQSPGCCA